jgi:hypothetical protein
VTTYFFPDAVVDGVAKPTRYHSADELEDREIQTLMLRLNATTVSITPNTNGATEIGGKRRARGQESLRDLCTIDLKEL